MLQKMIWPNGVARADMAEAVHHALVEQNAVRIDHFADRRCNRLGCLVGHGEPPFFASNVALAPDGRDPYHAAQDIAINPGQAYAVDHRGIALASQRSQNAGRAPALTERSLSFLVRRWLSRFLMLER
jgi:hypothetical protein